MISREFNYEVLARAETLSDVSINSYDRAYKYWSSFWAKFWDTSNGSQVPPASALGEIFYRQNVVNSLTHEGNFVGMVMQTKYDLRFQATKETPYFSHYPKEIFDQLLSLGIRRVVTHEFLTVDPDWRKTIRGFSVSEWLMALGARMMEALGGEGSVAIARKDIGVNKLCYRLGWQCLQEDVLYKGYPCDVICLLSGKSICPEPIKAIIDDLWQRRIDPICLTLPTHYSGTTPEAEFKVAA